MATQLHDHETLFPWVDRGLEDIKGQIKSLHKVYNDRFVDRFLGKS
jgi:hypothetical protein